MSTQRTFQDMLNEYLPNRLLREELIKRDYILQNIQKDNSWKGGKIIVPFKAAGASSVKMGGLTAANDIGEDQYVRGSIDDYKEAWGSLVFNHRDLVDHSGKIPDTTFLKVLPDTLNDFMEYMKMVVSIQLGTGSIWAKVTDDTNAATGVLIVDRIDRFMLNQKVGLKDNDTATAYYYVVGININTNAVTLSATRLGVPANLSAYSVAQEARFYTDGADTTSFQSITDALLAAPLGSATLHGKTKTDYPFLQAVNVNGAGVTTANILSKLFDFYNEVRTKARGKADTFLMSYKWLAPIMTAIENKTNGAANWNINVTGKKASVYGWDEITITSVKGNLTVVGIQEWDDHNIVAWDKTSMTFRSNGFFKKHADPEGKEYYVVRNTNGYQYIVDTCLFGELEVTKPGGNGIMFGIP